MIDVNNPSSYKSCRKKQAEYWLCKPPRGTILVSKLEQYEALVYLRDYIPQLRGRCFLTAIEAKEILSKNRQLYDFIRTNCYIIDNTNNMVLCGTEGELWVTTYDYVCSSYLMYNNNGYSRIPDIIRGRLLDYGDEKVMNWHRVINIPNKNSVFACFVPVNERGFIVTPQGFRLGYNQKGINHGKGDFIICSNVNGKPDLSNRYVVNGLVFSNTYDNRGWADCITIGRMGIAEPERLWSEIIKNEIDIDRDYVLSWLKSHNMPISFNYMSTNNLPNTVFKRARFMFNIVDYLHSKYSLSITNDLDGDFISLDHFAISLDGNGSLVYVEYNDTLCGWSRQDEKGTYYEEPLIADYDSYENVDNFMTMLVTDASTYQILKSCIKEVKGFEKLYDSVCSFNDSYIEALNKLSIPYGVLTTFLKNLYKAYMRYCSSKGIDLDFDLEDCIQFMFTVDGSKILATFCFSLQTPGSICAFAYNENDDILEFNIVYNRYSSYEEFLELVKLNKFDDENAEALNVVLDLPVSTIAYSLGGSSDFLLNYKGSYYVSDLGDFKPLLVQICEVLDSDQNFSELINVVTNLDGVRNGSKSISSEDFIKKTFSMMDDFIRLCVYNKSTDFISLDNLNIAKFEVIHISNIKRVYGFIRYVNGFSMPVNISKSTLKLLEYESPELVVKNFIPRKPNLEFIPLHYYQLMLRMGLIRNVYNIKKLKLLYMEYSLKIFDDKLPHTKVLSVGNYDRVDDDTFGGRTIAHHIGGRTNSIVFNGNLNSLQGELSPVLKCTLVHEMCHGYTEAIYGTTHENEGEDGGSYMHLGEWCKNQWFCHGKHFAEAVTKASQATGLSFDDIFGYGVGHPKLGGQGEKSDRNLLTLSPKNAFNAGQSYRKFYLPILDNATVCTAHGVVNCSCSSPKLEVSSGRYIGICRHCGKLHAFDDSTLSLNGEVSPDYFDVIDRLGIVATSKCSNCGGSLTPIITEMKENRALFKDYMKDLYFSDRYLNHILSVCGDNKSKYERYFIKNYGCSVELSRGRMPYLCIDITNHSSFKEMYKLFISCSAIHKPVGKLYRDYDLSMKGCLLHTFRINTDRDVLKFFEYVMSYIRKDLRGI